MARWRMVSSHYTLVIGDKNFSSWSLRPWIALKQAGLPVEERLVRLRRPGTKAEILQHSPSGKVPALKIGDSVIWDSLAILEFLAEAHPDAQLWPEDSEARALARSVSAEMHAGFPTVRNAMSMDWVSRLPMPPMTDVLRAEIERIVNIWTGLRARYANGGPFLFGAFSNADTMYLPVASRFRTYGVALERFADEGYAAAYAEAKFQIAAVDGVPARRGWSVLGMRLGSRYGRFRLWLSVEACPHHSRNLFPSSETIWALGQRRGRVSS
jgi:glutathione S-transferase